MPPITREPWQVELIPHISAYSSAYSESQYREMASDDDIRAFLDAEPLWDNTAQQWANVTSKLTLEDLRSHVCEVVNAIITKLGKKPTHGHVTREAFTTLNRPLSHRERDSNEGGTSPAVVIRATGPSFEDSLPSADQDAPGLAFSSLATYIDVGFECNMTSDDIWNVLNSSVYARQIFIQQPNRRFVRALLMSEEFCQLIHFDRSGAQYTSTFNIHGNVDTFIRVVLGLSSYDENVVGLDTAVQWTVEGGQKVGGTIAVTDTSGAETVYTLCDVEPTFRRFDLCGRGTTGWRVLSPAGVELFVKDSWRPEGGLAEYVPLEKVAGLNGVAQMVSYEIREITTSHLRANDGEGTSAEHFSNRISTRMVMEYCGKSIRSFESQRDLAAAIRDAIAAHQALVNDHDVLHRDISPNNILLGVKGARIGERGKLIDFDMAFHGPRPIAQTPKDIKVGTLFYMSASMLHARQGGRPLCPFHDQFDDLESFYYVLFDMMFSWAGVGLPVADRPSHVRYWGAKTDDARHLYREAHFHRDPSYDRLSPFWSPTMVELLVSFRELASELFLGKQAVFDLSLPHRLKQYKTLLGRADEFYARILAIFDKAITALDNEATGVDPPCTPEAGADATSYLPSLTPGGGRSEPTSAAKLSNKSGKCVSDNDQLPQNDDQAVSSFPDPETRLPLPVLTNSDGLQTPVRQTTLLTPKLPKISKRRVPDDFDLDDGPKLKRVRSGKGTTTRKTPWVRTSPHRTRAWVKAHLHLQQGQ